MNTNNIKAPSVVNSSQSVKFIRRNYGSMNAKARILSVLKQANGGMNAKDIAEHAKINAATASRALSSLKNSGIVSAFREENSKSTVKYWTQKV